MASEWAIAYDFRPISPVFTGFILFFFGSLFFGWGWRWWRGSGDYASWITSKVRATISCIIGFIFWIIALFTIIEWSLL